MFTSRTVTVLTAATGHANLAQCVRSVREQTYPQIEHWIVIDGPQHEEKVRAILAEVLSPAKTQHILTLPEPTGRNNWCGHRIYAAGSFLCNTEFVTFLDEDNWIEPDHIASLIAAMDAKQAGWAFALRRIVNASGDLITLDECESLGNLHSTFHNEGTFHVDTNCYLFRDVAVMIASLWYKPGGEKGKMEADTKVCQALLRHAPNPATNLAHTVNYLVANRPNSVSAAFFLHGNAIMRQKYPEGMPWKKSAK